MSDIKIFTDNIEETAKKQIETLISQPAFKDCKIRIMPDVHAGAGCVIGFTGNLGDKVIPNIVGVDIGCLDKDTEILTPKGWIKISDYDGYTKILMYKKEDDTAYFDYPYAYIKQPCKKFYHFKSKKGLDQMLSEEHKMLIWNGNKSRGYKCYEKNAKEVFDEHNRKKNYKDDYRTIKTTFDLKQKPLDISDNDIRIIVMLSADGCIRKVGNINDKYTRIEFHFSKQRKIERCKELLKNGNIEYKQYKAADGTVFIECYIDNNIASKSLNGFFYASKEQLKIVYEEALLWDGTKDEERKHYNFYSTNKTSIDLIQFAYAANGIRAGIYKCSHDENWENQYTVYQTNNQYVGFPQNKFEEIDSIDGYKYCFTTPTGFFIIRRNNNISITGNCGMLTVELGKIPIDLADLDAIIHKYVPSGFSIHPVKVIEFDKIKQLKCYDKISKSIKRFECSIGSLGGGNHFIEIDIDEDNNKYLVIHTGSRNLGKQVADYYQNLAIELMQGKEQYRQKREELIIEYKATGRESEISDALKELKYKTKNLDIPKELCYLEGEHRESYLHDMKLCQEYAVENRKWIANIILSNMNWSELNRFETVHNYIDHDNNIVRKGAIAAYKGQRVVIPMNMRDGCIIGIGKGNPDWNYSAPHGAGRIMSRAEARRKVSMNDYQNSMSGIYSSSVNKDTIDESPMAYKPMQEIIDNIGDTIEIERIIKPIYNFKASD